MENLDPYRLWSYRNGRFKIDFLHEYQKPLMSEGRRISEAYVERQRRIEAAVATAITAQFYQTAEGARPQHIQEARQEAWFLLYHTLGLGWSWFEATTFFQEMFGRKNTVIEWKDQYVHWRDIFLGEVPWDTRSLRALYAAVSAYEVASGLPMAQIIRRRRHRRWPEVVKETMLPFGASGRIPSKSIKVKYLQAFPRRPPEQQQQQPQQSAPQRLIEWNPHWND